MCVRGLVRTLGWVAGPVTSSDGGNEQIVIKGEKRSNKYTKSTAHCVTTILFLQVILWPFGLEKGSPQDPVSVLSELFCHRVELF